MHAQRHGWVAALLCKTWCWLPGFSCTSRRCAGGRTRYWEAASVFSCRAPQGLSGWRKRHTCVCSLADTPPGEASPGRRHASMPNGPYLEGQGVCGVVGGQPVAAQQLVRLEAEHQLARHPVDEVHARPGAPASEPATTAARQPRSGGPRRGSAFKARTVGNGDHWRGRASCQCFVTRPLSCVSTRRRTLQAAFAGPAQEKPCCGLLGSETCWDCAEALLCSHTGSAAGQGWPAAASRMVQGPQAAATCIARSLVHPYARSRALVVQGRPAGLPQAATGSRCTSAGLGSGRFVGASTCACLNSSSRTSDSVGCAWTLNLMSCAHAGAA